MDCSLKIQNWKSLCKTAADKIPRFQISISIKNSAEPSWKLKGGFDSFLCSHNKRLLCLYCIVIIQPSFSVYYVLILIYIKDIKPFLYCTNRQISFRNWNTSQLGLETKYWVNFVAALLLWHEFSPRTKNERGSALFIQFNRPTHWNLAPVKTYKSMQPITGSPLRTEKRSDGGSWPQLSHRTRERGSRGWWHPALTTTSGVLIVRPMANGQDQDRFSMMWTLLTLVYV